MRDNSSQATICSIIYIEVINFLQTPEALQEEIKHTLKTFLRLVLKDISQNDATVFDSADGIVIAYHSSPEYALYVTLSIRDLILRHNISQTLRLAVRLGVHLGLVSAGDGVDGHPNFVGEGIEVTHRMLGQARPNEILVSHAYYEVIINLMSKISTMLEFLPVAQATDDAQVSLMRKHVVYSVQVRDKNIQNTQEKADASKPQADKQMQAVAHLQTDPEIRKSSNLAMPATIGEYKQADENIAFFSAHWKWIITFFLTLAGLYYLAQMMANPAAPTITLTSPEIVAPPVAVVKVEKPLLTVNDPYGLMPNESIEEIPLMNENDLAQVSATTVAREGIAMPQTASSSTKVDVYREDKPIEPVASAPVQTAINSEGLNHEVKAAKVEEVKAPQVEAKPTEAIAPAEPQLKPQSTPVKEVEEAAKPAITSHEEKEIVLAPENTSEKAGEQEKSGWLSGFKSGQAKPCSQAEAALNQCR